MRTASSRAAMLLVLAACGDNVLPPSPAIFNPQQAGQICTTLKSCFPAEWAPTLYEAAFGISVSECTTGDFGPIPWPGTLVERPVTTTGLEPMFARFYACILAARGDCVAAGACFAQSGPSGSCVPDGLRNGSCNGTVLSGCTADGVRFETDCADYGEICGMYPLYFNACQLPCKGNTGCFGTSVVGKCLTNPARAVLTDCAAEGGTCVTGVGLSPWYCGALPGPECDPYSAGYCDDDRVLVTCGGPLAENVERRIDCGLQPTKRRCGTSTTSSPACVETGTECLVGGDRCDGADLVYCRDGYKVRQSCTELGFSGCEASPPAGARCVP